MRRRPEAENINGRYVNCAHYQGTTGDAYRAPVFTCGKHGERNNCMGCNICPKCGGFTYCESRSISHGMRHTIIQKEMKCLVCGLYMTEQVSLPKEDARRHKDRGKADGRQTPPPFCSVRGCRHRIWDGLQVEIETPDGIKSFGVCDVHLRRMQTWRYHKDKDKSEIPIIYFMGELIDNPKYRYSKKRK